MIKQAKTDTLSPSISQDISWADYRRRQSIIFASLLLLPAGVLLSLFAYIPSVLSIWSSLFSQGTRRRPSEFVGLDNYRDLFADPVFLKTVTNNLFYAAGTIPTSIVIALAMALWANSKINAQSFVRTAYFTPTLLPMIAAANLWLFFYDPDIGVLNQIGGALGFAGVNWLGQETTAMWSVIFVTIWKEAGFFMIFYLAALQNIPTEYREAAQLEGAGRWQYTRRIVLPLLMPTTLFILINATMNSIKMIDHLFILTLGGPDDATKLILFYIWEIAFAFFEEPQALALTMFILLVCGLLSAIQFFSMDKKVHYQ